MKQNLTIALVLIFLMACSTLSSVTPSPVDQATTTSPTLPATDTLTATPALPTETFTAVPPTVTSTPTEIPFVESLEATVTADLLSCRYGPGAEYLYLFAFRKGAKIKLIGRTDGNNWVLVENEPQRCWIKANYVQIDGDQQTLKPMYPDGFKLIVSPYYGPTTVLSAERKEDKITVSWIDVPVSPGKYESPDMFPYIIEVWRCENGRIIFDPLAARYPVITFVDQAGCDTPSHGRVYVQEKHGYAGPAEIPWPAP